MAQSSATIVNQNGFDRKLEDINSKHLSSSPRRTAIRKSSLRLSIPTIEQIGEMKNQRKLNQTDADNIKSVKQMMYNSGQLQSNTNSILNSDGQCNAENANDDACDINRVKYAVQKIDKNKRMNFTNGKTPTDILMTADDEKESPRNPFNENKKRDDKERNTGDIESSGTPHLEDLLSYTKFENDFKKRINKLNSTRQINGISISHIENLRIIVIGRKIFPSLNRSATHFTICTIKEHFLVDTEHSLTSPKTLPQQDC